MLCIVDPTKSVNRMLLLYKSGFESFLLYPGRKGCQGGPPILACSWSANSGTSGVNKSTSMLNTEVGFFSVSYGITAYTEVLRATAKNGRAQSILSLKHTCNFVLTT